MLSHTMPQQNLLSSGMNLSSKIPVALVTNYFYLEITSSRKFLILLAAYLRELNQRLWILMNEFKNLTTLTIQEN